MITRKPHRLMRHNTFAKTSEDQDTVLEYTFKKYKLTVRPNHFEFTLQFPDGSVINDTFVGLNSRRSLYENLEDGEVYSWLVEREHAIQLEDEMNRFISFNIPIGNTVYNISIDNDKNKGWLLFPEHVKQFELEDIYLQIAELPLIADARLNHEIRSKLEKYGVSLPATPYELGFSVKSKS